MSIWTNRARYVALVLLATLPVWATLTRPGLPPWQQGPLPVLQLYASERGESSAAGETIDGWRSTGVWSNSVARIARTGGWDGAGALKFSAGLAIIVLILGMLGWAGTLWGLRAGALAALLAAYAPVILGALYRTGDLGALWAAAGVALAGFGMAAGGWWLALALSGGFIAITAAPGLGVWAAAALLIFAFAQRSWRAALMIGIGAVVGLTITTPWVKSAAGFTTETGAMLYQLIEPGWLWPAQRLNAETPPALALGMPLLGLLLVAIWAGPGRRRRAVWLGALILGLACTALSLEIVANRIHLIQVSLRSPAQLLLLAVPFLAVAASAAMRALPDLRRAPIWAALLILPALAAGPALMPQFSEYAIPSAPAAIFGDNEIMLLQIESDSAVTPGATTTLHAEWLALRPPAFDYNFFAQVFDAAGNKWEQIDVQPTAQPSTSWQLGVVYSADYQFTVPADAPPDLDLLVGLYNWQTLARLPVGDSDALRFPQSALPTSDP